MSTHTQFVNVLQNKKQSVLAAKQNVLNRVTAAKQRILSPVTVISAYDDVEAMSYDDKLTSPEMYDSVYTEGTQPYQQPPIEFEEGNVRKHVDGSFSVIEADGYVHNFGFDEQTARSYGAYTTAKDTAKEEDAPEPGTVGDIANRLMQATVGIGGMAYTGAVGTGQTLRHQIDDYNSRGALRPVIVEPGSEYVGQRNPKITEEDEYTFNNIDQLNLDEQQVYKQSLKYKILSELQNRAEKTKENLVAAEEDIADINKAIPVDRSAEAARSADFKYVAETEGLWEATKHTLKEDWDSYLYGGIDAIPYMAVLATGNIPAITTLVTSMAIGNNVENTKEFLRLNDGIEPTQEEAARIQLFSAAQAAVDAIGDRLAVAGLPKAARAALSAQLVSAKKVLASTAKSVPPILNNFAVKIAARVATAPARMIVTEAPAGAAEEASRQIAAEGEITDTAAITEAAIIEGLAAPVAAPTVRVGAAVGRAVKDKVKGKKVDTEEIQDIEETQEGVIGVDTLIDDSDPTYGKDGADSEFYTLLDSITGENIAKDAATLIKIGKGVLTVKQKKAHLDKIAELDKKSKDAADNANPTEDESLGSLENFDDLTLVDLERFNQELEGRSDSDQEVIKTLANLQEQKERAKANTDDVAKEIREGTDAGWKGADTFFSRIKDLVQEMVSAPNPDLKEREILTEENKLQTHAGNLERKKEAFTEVNAVINGTIKRPVDLDPNNEITGKDGTVKPRVGTGGAGSDAIVIGVTPGGPGTGTIYTVYYNQSESEIKHAKAKHNTSEANYVTEVSRLRSGKSSIDRLTEIVTKDSDYVNSVATAATAYLKSELYANAKNKVEELRNNQSEIVKLKEEAEKKDTATIEATDEDIGALDQEGAAALDEDESRQKTINVFWGQAESNDSTRILSNLAPRTFTYEGREYGSVEHAYQSNKSGTFDQAIYDEYLKIRGFGKKIQGKATLEQLEAADNLGLMKELVVESFKQNPDSEAAVKLMQYENFTHNNNELIDQAFLEGLTLAQESLRESAQIAADATEVVEDSQTTQTEETSPEGTSVALQEETISEDTSEKLTKEELRARINADTLELQRIEEAEAAEQEAAPPVTEEEVTTKEDTVVTEPVSEDTDTTATETTAETTEEVIETYNNIKVIADDNIITAEGTKGAAQYDRKNKIIRLDRKFLQTKFAEKAWTAMRELIENVHGEKIKSKAENLPADAFNTYNEFEKFVIEHEYQHSVYTREDFNKDFPNGTKGEYETITNNRALAAIEQSLQESTETSYKLDGSNLRLLESELDVHTLSVVFPAAINADGTVKTGEAANAAIKKLGKFLKVCG